MNWDKKFTQWIGSTTSVVVHTFFFVGMFSLYFFGVDFDSILLVLTTLVSLEAIYLAIFIQMTVNQNTQSLKGVEGDIEEIKEDVDEIQEDVEGIEKDIDVIQENVDEIQEDVEGIEKDIDVIQEDVDEISEDIGEIQTDVDEIEKDTATIQKTEKTEMDDLESIHATLQKLVAEVEKLKRK